MNGAEGIGSGWSTSIPNYNPRELVEIIKKKLDGETYEKIDPFFKGFTGTFTKNGNSYFVDGCYEVTDSGVDIIELPIGKWTRDYKEFLETCLENNTVTDFSEHHTNNKVHF